MSKAKQGKQVYKKDDRFYGKEINVIPKPRPELGIDQDNVILHQLLQSGTDGIAGDGLNIQKIDSFCQVSQNRNTIYDLIDTMLEDPTIASAIEIYCEDATETNKDGKVMWVESDDDEVAHYIEYLLADLNVEKNMYRWVNCLVKYGDVYLRLYHESEYNDDDLFQDDLETAQKNNDKQNLNENVVLTAYKPSDNFVHYLNMIRNPAEMFELTKFGKTYAYIQAPVTAYMSKKKDTNLAYGNFTYNFKRKDVHIFTADNFVHGCLDDLTSREPEEVNLFTGDEDDPEAIKYHYDVRKGQSILYNTYKIWRENMLLEYALLLNRLSRSSSVKIVNVEMGDMPKNQIPARLNAIKQLFEQKTALAVDEGMNEYNNSGPTENIIYTASHNGQGTITTQEVTNDLNVTGLDDVDLFRNKLFSSLKIPKNYLGDTDDAGGFDGGTSLSLLSSRYAKTIKRIQNTMIQTITDAINIMLVDNGYMSYINKYRLRMQEPTTREENDRQENMVNRISVVQNTMSLFDDIQDASSRLTILKNLLGDVISDPDVLSEIEKQIDLQKKLEEQQQGESGIDDSDYQGMDMPGGGIGGFDAGPDMGGMDLPPDDSTNTPPMDSSGGGDVGGGELPSPADLGVDMT